MDTWDLSNAALRGVTIELGGNWVGTCAVVFLRKEKILCGILGTSN